MTAAPAPRPAKPDPVYYAELLLSEVFAFLPEHHFTGYEIEDYGDRHQAPMRFVLIAQAKADSDLNALRTLNTWCMAILAVTRSVSIRPLAIGHRSPNHSHLLIAAECIYDFTFKDLAEVHIRCEVRA